MTIEKMRKETVVQKKERIFNFYKKDLAKLNKANNQIRFNVIQYVCSFPDINPFKMAAVLMSEGCNVVFDDSSITEKQNANLRKKVISFLHFQA